MAERTRQRESLPKFDLIAAKAAMDRIDAAVCVFELCGRMIGQAFILDVAVNFVVVNSLIINDDMWSEERQDKIETIVPKNHVDRCRRLFICPGCGANKWALYFNDGWSCAGCLHLTYRSQLVDKEVKLWEEREELRPRLKSGRPKGMHNRTYMELRQRLFALDNRLSGRFRKFASAPQDMVVHSRWVPGSEIDLWSMRYCVRQGMFVQCA